MVTSQLSATELTMLLLTRVERIARGSVRWVSSWIGVTLNRFQAFEEDVNLKCQAKQIVLI